MSFRTSVPGHGHDDLLGTHIEACFRRGYRCGVLCRARAGVGRSGPDGRRHRVGRSDAARGSFSRRGREDAAFVQPRRRARPRRLSPFGSGRAAGLPQGAALAHTDGNPAKAKFTWTPSRTQRGEYRVTFTASSDAPVGADPADDRDSRRHARTSLRPGPANPPGVYPKRTVLSDRSTETYQLGVRPPAHRRAHRPLAQCARGLSRSRTGRRSSTGTRSRSWTGSRTQRHGVGSHQARDPAEQVDRLGAEGLALEPSRRFTPG